LAKALLALFLTLSSLYPIPHALAGMNSSSPIVTTVYEKIPQELMFWADEITEIEHQLEVCHYGVNKTYMDYRALNTSSAQYKLLMTMTIREGLFYTFDGYIAVALGSYFGPLGSKYSITLSSGVVLDVIKAEEKADRHTNDGCEQKWDKSVIEFVIDSQTLPYWVGSKGYFLNGNFNNADEFYGDIIKIVRK